MTYTTKKNLHVDKIHSTVSCMVDASNIESMVERSWHRCIDDYGLSPSSTPLPHVLEKIELRECEEHFSKAREISQNSVNKLYEFIADIGYTILLTDNNGITLDCRYNLDHENTLKKLGLYHGTNWSENISGTNGIGTCLVEKSPVLIRTGEHFFHEMFNATCTVSPIFDSKGKIMAALNATTLLPETANQNKLISRLVEQHAMQIEILNFIQDFSDHWILKFSTGNDLTNIIKTGILAVNQDGVIVAGNRNSYNLLYKKNRADLNNKYVHDIFKSNFSAMIDNHNKNIPLRHQLTTLEHQDTFFFELRAPSLSQKNSSSPSKQKSNSKVKQPHCKEHPHLSDLAGNDIHMQIIGEKIKKVINLDLNILLIGETGSGKEALAKAIHHASERQDQPFIAINCAAIPESLIESELFGYSSGTFTGGLKNGMKGKVLQANGGTLFLDEIGDMPLHLQTRLLRVLSEMEVIPLGETTPTYLDIQLISATNKSITEMVKNNTFRKDLYYRLNGITLEIPSLRNRTDKRELIVNIFNEYSSLKSTLLSESSLDILEHYQWPGNIRQLINVAKYSAAMCTSGEIQDEHLPKEIRSNKSKNIKENLQHSEYEILINCLKINKWNITKVSKQLGICRATVYRKINKYKIIFPNDE